MVKRERWRNKWSIEVVFIFKGSYSSLGVFGIKDTFLHCCWELKWFKKLVANIKFFVKAVFMAYFLSLCGNVTGEHIWFALFAFLNMKDIQLQKLLYAAIIFCFQFHKPVNFTSLAGVAPLLVLPHQCLFPFVYYTAILFYFLANFNTDTFKRTLLARYCFVRYI